jgi:TolB protein
MRHALSVSLLLLSVTVQEACQRDEATAPQVFAPSAALAGVFKASLAFTSDRDGSAGIYRINPDGSGEIRLAKGSAPSWSPDGSQIAFVDFVDGRPEIFVMNADGSAPLRLTDNRDVSPSWSPDGRQIAFTSSRDGNAEIYVMNRDGSAVTRLTTNSARDDEPSWSPEGGQIAFTSNRDGNDEIYVMNADGSSQTRLTNSPTTDQSPTWSPDGQRIAFASNPGFNFDIYAMNLDGSALTRLTNSSSIELEPSWSPDGQQIAFMSFRDGNHEIYVMNADGSAQTRLTNNPATDQGPAWSPKIPSRSPARLAFTTQPPAGTWANAAISPAVQVTVVDESGDLVPGGTVRLALGTSPAPGATLSGTTTALIVHGVATFSDVRVDQLGRGYTLLAETARHVSGTSTPFTIVEPATHLAFVTQPPATVDGGAAITVRVAIQDTLGNTLTSASAPVTLALAPHPTGVTIATTTVETVDGIATFSNVHIDQLGSGYRFEVAAPGRAGATSNPFAVQVAFAFVDAGTGESCGMTDAGAGYCWGNNLYGSLGSGKGGVDANPQTPLSWPSPLPVWGGLGFTTISVGHGGDPHACGVTTSGAAYCWGTGIDGQRGDGRSGGPAARSANTPRAVLGGLTFTTISAGARHTCGVTTGGATYCWGSGFSGALGTGSFVFVYSAPTRPVAGGFTFTTVGSGGSHTCGVTTSGAAYCWGSNGSGQLGDGTNTWTYGPVPVAGGLGFTSISAGGSYTCGVTTDGAAYCWGSNTHGELGDGTTAQQPAPVPVAGGLRFATISAGSTHTCGVTTSGEAYCWGANPDGRLGDGTTSQATTPVKVAGGLTFATVRAGGNHSCGATTSREAYCWGANELGQLGNGTQTASLTPTRVATGTPSMTVMRTVP